MAQLCFILILASTILSCVSAQVTTYQTIFEGAAFSAQDTCAQNCFTHCLAGCCNDYLGNSLGCSASPNACMTNIGVPNSCYCRSDKWSTALAILSSCVSSACTVGDPSVDIDSALSIYTAYCEANNFAPATVAATTTQANTNTQATTTSTVYVTETRSSGTRFSPAVGFIAINLGVFPRIPQLNYDYDSDT